MERNPGNWQFAFVSDVVGIDQVSTLASGFGLYAERRNLPPNTIISRDSDFLIPFSQPTALTVLGPYIQIRYTIPSNISGSFTWDGRVRIYRKSRSFMRKIADPAATLFLDVDYSGEAYYASIPRDSYEPIFVELDQNIGQTGDIWYYTIMYGNSITGNFSFNQEECFARNWALVNNATSKHGDFMYSLLARRVQHKDATDTSSTTYRVFQILGRAIDQMEEEILQVLDKNYDIENIDASMLPYIDDLIGWMTNFDLDEEARRVETSNVFELWREKGTANALEFIIQLITGWDVEIFDGWKKTFYNSPRLDYDSGTPPAGWNPPTDGVWADLVNAYNVPVTFDPSRVDHLQGVGTELDGRSYTVSNEEMGAGGLGWPWQNPNGILIRLTEVPGAEVGLTGVVLKKVVRLAPLFIAHYVTYLIAVSLSDTEQYNFEADDLFVGDLLTLSIEESYDLLGSDQHVSDQVNLCLMYSFPHPTHPDDARSNNVWFRSYSSAVTWTCSVPVDQILRHHLTRL
jgi:hypothetical protein